MSKSKTKKTKKTRDQEPVEAPERPTVEAGVPEPEPRNIDLPGIEGPGVALPRFKDLDAATEEYVNVRNRRMALTEEEVAAKEALATLMHEHGLTVYRYDDYKVVILPGKENIKVKNAADDTTTVDAGGSEGDGE